MSNTNCLKGICCPKCGQENRFFIIGGAQFEVTDEGSEAVGNHEWDDESATRCPECGHSGALKDFHATAGNDARAERAQNVLKAYVEARSEVFENNSSEIADLIADLLHLAVRIDDADNGPSTVLRLAQMHFDAEYENPEECEAA